MKTGNGDVRRETRDLIGEGIFLYCSERLREGITYSAAINLSENLLEVTGKLTWPNLNDCTSLTLNSAMGFYFIKIAEDKGRQALRAAIAVDCGKPLRVRQEAEQLTDLLPSNEAEAIARFDGNAFNTQLLRN